MEKRDFIKKMSLLGLTAFVPLGKSFAKVIEKNSSCTLIPTETSGPFPLDLTANTYFFRKDVKENKTGVPLNVKLKILGVDNCSPMPNLRVNIWHCDKDGLYSGYSQTNNQGQAGLTYCRGYQFTDADGIAEFDTILPGWYSGRICHIHFQVYVNSSYAAISQLTFNIAQKQAIYSANPTLYTKGQDPMTLSSDNIFSDGYQYQLCDLVANTNGGYDAYLEVSINGSGTTGLGYLEKVNRQQFLLSQNFPNPFKNETSIPFVLKNISDVKLVLYSLDGKEVYSKEENNMSIGNHTFHLDFESLNLPSTNYVYQLEVRNENGEFKDCKMMTNYSK